MGIKVTAVQKGYWGLKVREAGKQFEIEDESEFSPKWMVKGHQSFSPEDLVKMGRDGKRRSQQQLIDATKGQRRESVEHQAKSGGRISDKSPI